MMRSISVFASALLLCVSLPLAAQSPYSLAPLPYDAKALEPVIDEATMKLHHGKHHQSYVDNLNKALDGNKELQGLSLEALVARAGTTSTAIRNNGGGHWNHTFFWNSMAPTDKVGKPSKELTAAINSSFGSMEKFKEEFKQAGLSRFGSGWVWLIADSSGKLKVTSTPNQDNPLMDVVETKGTPLLGNDVWEHAYYLQYNNRRADYLDGWWKVVDWAKVSERFAAAK